VKPGEVVAGRFTIERPAGYGAMGAVYRAMDRLTGAPVALKVLHKEGSKRNVRFEREATLLAALRHPAVVRYVLHGATPAGAPFLAMEWVDGETLSDRLTDAPLSVEDSILVMSTIASALAEAHAHGVVHRDLKPGNVLLADGDVRRVKVIDFGIARRPESELTATGVAIGSPGYMAPEHACSTGASRARRRSPPTTCAPSSRRSS
jgi:serine/threonine protein kinase